MNRFKIYPDARGEYRWRLLAANGKIIADSAEGYTTKSACKVAISLVKTVVPGAVVEE